MQLEPYLQFDGNCEEALAFYATVFGGEVTALNRFEGAPMEHELPPGYGTKIMHANFRSPDLAFMASDGMPGTDRSGGGRVSLSLGGRDVAEAERVFAALSAGGTVTMPMADTFWGAKFGMVTDRYGVNWMVNCERS